MGAQSLNEITLDSKREFFENKMIEEGKDYLLFKHYHLGDPTDFRKLMHLNNLHKSYSSPNCNVQAFIRNKLKLDHNYTKIENTRMCEEFDICYNN